MFSRTPAGEEVRILQHHGKRAAKVVLFDLPYVDAVVGDRPLLHVVEAVDKVCDGRLARAGGADKRDLLAGFGKEVHALEHVHLAVVAEGYVVETHVALQLDELEPVPRR